MNKNQIRQHMYSKRKLLDSTRMASCAADFCKQLVKHRYFITSQHIAFYYPCNNEVDIMPALHHALSIGKTCYLPHVKDHNKNLDFIYFDETTALIPGKYNILSPKITNQSIFISPEELDLVIMPAVAIDRNHHRIGMGKGYYDYTFKNITHKPNLIATCYEFQVLATITPDKWDINYDDCIVV